MAAMHSPHHHLHDTHHEHAHAPADFGRAFFLGTVLNLGFVVIEAVYGLAANSMALLADAGHNLSDVLGLLIAWGAASLSKRAPTTFYSYGFRRTSILAALFNALFLLVAIGAIALEAVQRLSNPQPVEGGTVMAVAAIGILVNGLTAWLFASGRKGDINVRGAFLHMAADAAVSAGVMVSGYLVLRTGLSWLDPITSLVIVAVIFLGTWSLLRQSVAMSLDRVPEGIAPAEVEALLTGLPGVAAVHDLHIWPISTTEVALTCHLLMPEGCPSDAFLDDAVHRLRDQFKINHATIQVERGDGGPCAQGSAAVI